MQRDQLVRHKTSTYVVERHQVVYVSVNKAACTSLKWLVAELQGEDPERFHRSVSREVARAMTIHRRPLWQKTPMLHQLPDQRLAEIAPDRGWFIFAVVRHPSARAFSGWQSKFLLREPRWHEMQREAEWFPRVPATTQDIVADFRAFVLAMAANPRQPLMSDRHFMAQHAMLSPERFPYSRIYETREIPELMADLEAHLRAHGYDGPALALRQSNETPLQPTRAMFDRDVQRALRTLYGADFETFGFEDVVPDKLHPGDEYDPRDFAEIGRLIERHERIGDLAATAQALRRRLRERDAGDPAAPDTARAAGGTVRRVGRRLAGRAS